MICEIFQQNIFINLLFIIKINAGISRNGSYMSHLLYVSISRVSNPDNLYYINFGCGSFYYT